MGYRDKGIVPFRHIGKMPFAGTGIRAYTEPLAVLTGTFLTTPTEAEVIAGTQTIILTLGRGTWVSAGAVFDAIRQAIIDGLDSDKSEATGWNTKVRDVMAVTAVVRTNATTVTITLPATGDYNVSANETITFTLPRGAVEGFPEALGDVVIPVANATPTITAALTGTFLATPTEAEVVAGAQTIIITLTGGIYVPTGAVFNAMRQAIIDGMVSAESEAAGWNVEVLGTLVVGEVARTNDTTVTITLPACGSYSITADENVTVTVPRLAMATADDVVVAAPVIVIANA